MNKILQPRNCIFAFSSLSPSPQSSCGSRAYFIIDGSGCNLRTEGRPRPMRQQYSKCIIGVAGWTGIVNVCCSKLKREFARIWSKSPQCTGGCAVRISPGRSFLQRRSSICPQSLALLHFPLNATERPFPISTCLSTRAQAFKTKAQPHNVPPLCEPQVARMLQAS